MIAFMTRKSFWRSGSTSLGLAETQVGRAHDPHEGQITGEELLELCIGLHAFLRVECASPGDDEPVHLDACRSSRSTGAMAAPGTLSYQPPTLARS
jgi:hypothetical protein